MDAYDTPLVVAKLKSFVEDLSTWYLRRSRDRKGDEFYSTLYEVLVTFSKVMAPVAPFISEEIYRNLTGKESVHLENWPKVGAIDEKLISSMSLLRKMVEIVHAQRKAAGIRLRQPLARVIIYGEAEGIRGELEKLLLDELNVKKVEYSFDPHAPIEIELDTRLTPELEAEGKARDLVREIQDARKAAGTALDEKVIVILLDWPKEYTDYISKETLATKLIKGNELKIERL